MNNSRKNLSITVAITGLLAVVAPITVSAQEASTPTLRPAAVRQINLDRNRDIRNETLKQRAVAPAARMVMTTERFDRAADIRHTPVWLTSSTTTAWARSMSPATRRSIQQIAAKYASTTLPGGHENWEKVRLDIFAALQNRLLVETQDSLSNLKDLRMRIAEKILVSGQQGHDMTQASQLLVVADQKIAAAESAIADIAAIVPSFVAGTVIRVEASTEVDLEGPRETGKAAISALGDARKALNDVIRAIAREIASGTKATPSTQQ